jgi:hypothetical protein
MGATVFKPEVDLGEKLRELSGTVPYSKMPSGSVIGVYQSRFDTRTFIDHSATNQYTNFDELDIEIYPKTAGSKFLVQAIVVHAPGDNPNGGPTMNYVIGDHVFHGPHNYRNHTYAWWADQQSNFIQIDDTLNDGFTTSSSNWQYLSDMLTGSVLFEPCTTDKVTFRLGYEGGDTFYVNRNAYSGGSADYGAGWTTLTVMEIAA